MASFADSLRAAVAKIANKRVKITTKAARILESILARIVPGVKLDMTDAIASDRQANTQEAKAAGRQREKVLEAIENKLDKLKPQEIAEAARKLLGQNPMRVHAELLNYLEAQRKEFTRLGEDLRDGRISTEAFRSRMIQLIKATHLAATLIKVGGVTNMSDAVFALMNESVAQQIGFLNKFVSDLQGRKATQRDVARAASYTDAAYVTAQQALRQRVREEFGEDGEERRVLGSAEHCEGCIEQAGQGWVPIGTLEPIGSQECAWKCKCRFEYRQIPKDRNR